MNSLTKKLFGELSNTKKDVKINDELLYYLRQFEDLEEYKILKTAHNSGTENLKKLVYRLYGEHKLKDLDFFKYLAWSGQGELCKLIGYGDKQIEKLMKDKPDVLEKDTGYHRVITHDDKVMDTGHTMPPKITRMDVNVPQTADDCPDRPIQKVDVPAATIDTQEVSQPEGPPAYIVYSKEHSDAVLEVSNFLRNCCGISCEIDQYYQNKSITNWESWSEQKITTLAKCNGYVLLLCSPIMYQQLSQPDVSVIQMKDGHINNSALNNLIKGQATTHCIIPVCLEELNKDIVPISLRDRTIYHLSFSMLMQTNVESIMEIPELESLRSLVFRLRGEKEVIKPPLGILKQKVV